MDEVGVDQRARIGPKTGEADDQPKPVTINHFQDIVSIVQRATDCWARSSQMFFSWILTRLGLTKDDIEEIFFHSLIPKRFLEEKTEEEIQDGYKTLTQLLLGRRLAVGEPFARTFNSLVEKMYAEWGHDRQDPHFFGSVIINYLHVLSTFNIKIQLTLYMEDPDPFKKNPKIVLSDIRRLEPALVYNDLWHKMSTEDRLARLLNILQFSPILARSRNHAFVISGWDEESQYFVINDSLSGEPSLIHANQFLRYVQAVTMFVRVPKTSHN